MKLSKAGKGKNMKRQSTYDGAGGVARTVLDVVSLIKNDAVPVDAVQDARFLDELAFTLETLLLFAEASFGDGVCVSLEQGEAKRFR